MQVGDMPTQMTTRHPIDQAIITAIYLAVAVIIIAGTVVHIIGIFS